jgi:hypothetical protein
MFDRKNTALIEHLLQLQDKLNPKNCLIEKHWIMYSHNPTRSKEQSLSFNSAFLSPVSLPTSFTARQIVTF